MKDGLKSSQFWLTVGIIILASVFLMFQYIDIEAWKYTLSLALGALGLRKAAEHINLGK